MNKMWKRFLAVSLCVLLLLSAPMSANIFAGFALTAGAAGYSGTCGENLTWTLDTTTGILAISGTGEMKDYDYAEAPWYSDRSSIREVRIANGVTSIGNYAFYRCASLTSVTIPDSVTSIGDWAFAGCTSLTSVTIPDSVTRIGWQAFYGCTSLTSVTIPDSVTSIDNYAFCSCASLTSITVKEGNPKYSSDEYGVLLNKGKTLLIQYPVGNTRTSYTIPDSVTSIGDGAFEDCTSLTSVTIPDSVTSIGAYAFEDCTSLTSVTIPDRVTSIGNYAFYGCTSLTSVTIGDSVTSIGDYAFRGCTSLTSITIGDSVKSIGSSAFYGCTRLTSVTIGDSVTSIGDCAFFYCASLTSVTIGDSVISIGDYAFYKCTSLTSVTIGDSVKSIGDDAFYGCTSLTSITVNEGNPKYSSDEYGVLLNKDKTLLIQYPIGNTRTSYTIPDSVTRIGNEAFKNCSSLNYVHIPDSVTTIGILILNRTSAYICSDTAECYAKKYAEANSIEFRVCEGHIPPHDHDYVSTVTAPTCTEQGYTTHTCTICGDTYTDSVVDALGHSYKSVVTAPTCTEQGYTTHTCTTCGDSYRDSFVDPLPAIFIRNYKGETTVDYRTTITFAAEVPKPIDGAKTHWFVDGKDVGTGDTYTVKEAKKNFTVQAKYMDGDKVLAESEIETVKVKSGFFDKLKAFFRALFKKLPVLTQEYLGIERITTR